MEDKNYNFPGAKLNAAAPVGKTKSVTLEEICCLLFLRRTMKRLLCFCILFFVAVCQFFPFGLETVDTCNEFGGITVEYQFVPVEPQYESFYKLQAFFDDSDSKRKEIYFLSEKLQDEKGILTQSNIFSNGRIEEYRIHLTESEVAKKGVSILIKKVNADNAVYAYGYSDGFVTAYSSADSFVTAYPLYSLNYIEKDLFPPEKNTGKKAVYRLSAKYKKARTFVRFSSEASDMTSADKELVSKYTLFLNDPDKAELYNKKYQVESGGRMYTVYVQDSLIPYLTTPYLTEDGACLLSYGTIGYNDELYLIATEFSEIQ